MGDDHREASASLGGNGEMGARMRAVPMAQDYFAARQEDLYRLQVTQQEAALGAIDGGPASVPAGPLSMTALNVSSVRMPPDCMASLALMARFRMINSI
jgi:hypothetical protein